jgi:hypothetical protein
MEQELPQRFCSASVPPAAVGFGAAKKAGETPALQKARMYKLWFPFHRPKSREMRPNGSKFHWFQKRSICHPFFADRGHLENQF